MPILASRPPRVVNIFLTRDLLANIDARAAALGMPRSRYLAFLAMSDVDRGGALRIQPRPEPGTATTALDSVREIAEFLAMAVPALADYHRRKDDPQAVAAAPEPPESSSDNQFWNDFLDERDEILTLKWIESEKAGRDIGYERAIQLWLKHRPEWRAAHAAAAPLAGQTRRVPDGEAGFLVPQTLGCRGGQDLRWESISAAHPVLHCRGFILVYSHSR